jgi:hypothetical protein
VALHLRSQNQFRLRGNDGVLDIEMIVRDQRLDAVFCGGLAHIAGEFTRIGAEPANLEAEFFGCDPGGGNGMGGVAKHEHPLAGEIIGVDRGRVPGKPFRAAFEQFLRNLETPATFATSATKSRVAPTPIGTVVTISWPNWRLSQRAVVSAISG